MLQLTNLSKKYDNKVLFDSFNFSFEDGLVYTIFGPNGCGKSTLLNIIAGLESDYTGEVEYDSLDRSLNFVFQNYNESIMPWLSVYENIELGLGKTKKDLVSKSKIQNLLKVANIQNLANQKACNLSGGQKQLVCILRSLVSQPQLLLMDEPFSAIDFLNTRKLHSTLKMLIDLQTVKPTCLIVTHDPIEAIILGDRVLVLGLNNKILELGVENVNYYNDAKVLDYQKQILDWINIK